jgi:hypothetical protein
VPEWMPIVVMAATLIIFNTAIMKLLQVRVRPDQFSSGPSRKRSEGSAGHGGGSRCDRRGFARRHDTASRPQSSRSNQLQQDCRRRRCDCSRVFPVGAGQHHSIQGLRGGWPIRHQGAPAERRNILSCRRIAVCAVCIQPTEGCFRRMSSQAANWPKTRPAWPDLPPRAMSLAGFRLASVRLRAPSIRELW